MKITTTIEDTIGQLLPMIQKLSRKIDRENADDLAQQTALNLLRTKPCMRKLQCNSYIYTAVKHAFYDMCRAKRAENLIVDRTVEIYTGSAVREELQEYEMYMPATTESTDRIDAQEIERVLEELPKNQYNVLMLHVEGYSYTEIAGITDASIGTVRSRLHYARVKAQKLVAPLV